MNPAHYHRHEYKVKASMPPHMTLAQALERQELQLCSE